MPILLIYLRIVVGIVMPKSSENVVELINDVYFRVSDVQKGDLEVQPTYLTTAKQNEMEFPIFASVVQLIDRSKYDDIDLIYGGPDKDIEEGFVSFYSRGELIGALVVGWDNRYSIFPEYLIEEKPSIESKQQRPFLGPERNAIIEVLLPYYGKRVVNEEMRKRQ